MDEMKKKTIRIFEEGFVSSLTSPPMCYDQCYDKIGIAVVYYDCERLNNVKWPLRETEEIESRKVHGKMLRDRIDSINKGNERRCCHRRK